MRYDALGKGLPDPRDVDATRGARDERIPHDVHFVENVRITFAEVWLGYYHEGSISIKYNAVLPVHWQNRTHRERQGTGEPSAPQRPNFSI